MKKVLIVDDNKDVVFSILDGLKSVNSNYEYLKAYSGSQALRIIEKEDINLVILDIMMPGKDGWTVATEIKGNPKFKNIPVLFLSAKTDALSKKFGSMAVEEFIEKPFDLMNLKMKIDKWIK